VVVTCYLSESCRVHGINDVIDGAIAVFKTFKTFTTDAGLGESGSLL
jgi:hypothetical protein